jgi:hypothetical protein
VVFVVDKAALWQVFSEYFGFPCQSFHRFLRHHYHLGPTQLAIGGRSVEWTSIPPPTIQTKIKLTQYRAGHKNCNADSLSRYPVECLNINVEEIREETKQNIIR